MSAIENVKRYLEQYPYYPDSTPVDEPNGDITHGDLRVLIVRELKPDEKG